MVRKAGLGLALILISILIFEGCERKKDNLSDELSKEENIEEAKKGGLLEIKESDKMNRENVAEKIQKLLNCNIRTAVSIDKQCSSAGVEDVADVEIQPNDVYTLLKMSDKNGTDYYVFLGDGFFLEQIRKGAEDGEQIYMAME